MFGSSLCASGHVLTSYSYTLLLSEYPRGKLLRKSYCKGSEGKGRCNVSVFVSMHSVELIQRNTLLCCSLGVIFKIAVD